MQTGTPMKNPFTTSQRGRRSKTDIGQFIGAAIGAWAVFGLVCAVGTFKPGAGIVWAIWLTFITTLPIVVWWRNRA